MKITLHITIPDYNLSAIRPEDLGDIEKIAPFLSFSQFDMTSIGHVQVGAVEIDAELLPPDQIVGNAVIALRAKAAGIRAKATVEATQLESRAQQLLAIEYTPAAEAAEQQ